MVHDKKELINKTSEEELLELIFKQDIRPRKDDKILFYFMEK